MKMLQLPVSFKPVSAVIKRFCCWLWGGSDGRYMPDWPAYTLQVATIRNPARVLWLRMGGCGYYAARRHGRGAS